MKAVTRITQWGEHYASRRSQMCLFLSFLHSIHLLSSSLLISPCRSHPSILMLPSFFLRSPFPSYSFPSYPLLPFFHILSILLLVHCTFFLFSPSFITSSASLFAPFPHTLSCPLHGHSAVTGATEILYLHCYAVLSYWQLPGPDALHVSRR
jgi:hypothetical protein